MARVTIEDCLVKETSQFDLVMQAAERARELMRADVDPLVDPDGDKATVIALREIAEGLLQQASPAQGVGSIVDDAFESQIHADQAHTATESPSQSPNNASDSTQDSANSDEDIS